MEDLGADWHREVRDCVNQYSDKRTKLWSFEAKLLINRSNVRECFFQAVSNSSWANFGYLVAAEIEGQDTLKELRMLFAAHGIGLIKLDADNPAESQVLIPARERDEIDWDMANRKSDMPNCHSMRPPNRPRATDGPDVGHGWATKQNAHSMVGVALEVFTSVMRWLRGLDLNQRPLGYEPNELPDCSTPRLKNVIMA